MLRFRFAGYALVIGLATAMLAGCGTDDGARTIDGSVAFPLPCYSSAEHWYTAIERHRQVGSYPDDSAYQTAALMAGDRVKLLEMQLVDEQPRLVTVTGWVQRVKVLSGPSQGVTCWLYSGSNPNGPLFN